MATTINFQSSDSTIISTDTGIPVNFSLTNHGGKTLKLYWVDRAGSELLYQTIQPGQTVQQGTMSSHAWLLKSDDGTFATKFLPAASGLITIAADYTPQFLGFGEKIIHTADGLWSTYQGHGLIDVAQSLGVADTGLLPLGGDNNHLALNAIKAPAAWAAGITGKGVKVAVVDSGIADHAELAGKIVAGHDFQDGDTTPQPDEGPYQDHALGVAAIIAASHAPQAGRDTLGVAPDAQLINVRVGSSTTGSSSDKMAAGIRYAVDQGAKVICMPLQSPATMLDGPVTDAVQYAYDHDVVTVIIGGNYSHYGPTGGALIALERAGISLSVGNFSVGAGAMFDSSNLAGDVPFNWVVAGSTGWVPDTRGGYSYYEDGGTSFAGPYVAGLAALLWQQNPDASAAEIMQKITQGASLGNQGLPQDLPLQDGGTDFGQVLHAEPNTMIDAGGGLDFVVFDGSKDDYAIAARDGRFTLTHRDGSVNLLANVERLTFADATVALDVDTGSGGDVFRLYQAAFGRAPDEVGLGYWIAAMDGGASLHTVASSFMDSKEFTGLYGSDPSDLQLVIAMYRNVLQRAPDSSGMIYWLERLEDGMDGASLLASFTNSGENREALAEIIGEGFAYVPAGA